MNVSTAYTVTFLLGLFVPIGSCITLRYSLEFASPFFPGDEWGLAMGLLGTWAVFFLIDVTLLIILARHIRSHRETIILPIQTSLACVVLTNAIMFLLSL